MEEYLFNISPIDGRYQEMTEEVKQYFSEYHLIRNRVIVEVEWLKKLVSVKELNIEISQEEIMLLDKIKNEFDLEEAKIVKGIEKITKHDVKAVEYYLNEKLKENNMAQYNYLVHFACTSEDINNMAYGIMLKELLNNIYIPNVSNLIKILEEKANQYATIAMLSHTHGQKATPTTVGKELAIFAFRLRENFK